MRPTSQRARTVVARAAMIGWAAVACLFFFGAAGAADTIQDRAIDFRMVVKFVSVPPSQRWLT